MIRIGLLGLGGVGGYFGAKLSRSFAGSSEIEVVFLARENTAAVIRTHGIKLITPEEQFVAHPSAVATPDSYRDAREAGRVDFLIVSVKSYDLESSLLQFKECISSQTIILPLLNGIDAEERIRSMFPENEVWSGCVYIVSRLTAPGVITETGNIHRLHFGGANPVKTKELFLILKACHDDIFLHDNIREVVWEKFVFISTIASLTSYLDVCIGKILEDNAHHRLLEQLLDEICSVAQAEKIVLPANIVALTLEKMSHLPYETTSSMHSDFQAQRSTEYLSLTQHVVDLAKKHKLVLPVYQRILEGLELRTKNIARQ